MSRKTRDWEAFETSGIIGKRHELAVEGEFESLHSNETAHLKEAVPQGTNPKILILDLVVSSSGVGTELVSWKPVKPFEKTIAPRQYSDVTIRDGSEGHTVSVRDVFS